MTTPVPQIYGLMAKAIKAFGEHGITKDSKNSYQKFNYRSVDSTLAAANKVFSELGLFFTIDASQVSFGRETVRLGDRDRIDFSLQALYTFTFYAPDGSFVQCKDIPAANTGTDDSKLSGQVLSYVFKEVLFKTFLIPTTGNEDVDALSAERNQPPAFKPKNADEGDKFSLF